MAIVIDSQQIHLPEYPKAFNPSIVSWKGKLLMSFRNIADPKDSYNSSQIGVVWLNDSFETEGESQILLGPSRAEDARLIVDEDHLYMIYSDNEDLFISKGGFRVYVAELEEDDKRISIKSKERLEKFEGANPLCREKNWTPFIYQSNLLLSYSLNPHLVFKPLFGRGECETVGSSIVPLAWKWGELRGGTQLLSIGDRYLTFFHSSLRMSSEASQGKPMLHYFMGAAIFEGNSPFQMTHISPEPIVGVNFFAGPFYQQYWGSWRGIFPGGFIFNDEFIWVVYGKQNREIWISKLNKKALLDSLIPIFIDPQCN
jgi:predicted GH43/DUF377 family glycosyl hydrolase